jgi:hypothetical protein
MILEVDAQTRLLGAVQGLLEGCSFFGEGGRGSGFLLILVHFTFQYDIGEVNFSALVLNH